MGAELKRKAWPSGGKVLRGGEGPPKTKRSNSLFQLAESELIPIFARYLLKWQDFELTQPNRWQYHLKDRPVDPVATDPGRVSALVWWKNRIA